MSRFSNPQTQREWRILRKQVFDRDKGICGVCGGQCFKDAFHLGHIVDHMIGGTDTLDNLLVMHGICNMLKPVHETRAEFDAWVKAGHWHTRMHTELKKRFKADYSKTATTQILKVLCNLE